MRSMAAAVLDSCWVPMLAMAGCAMAGCAIDARDTTITSESGDGDVSSIRPGEVDAAAEAPSLYASTGNELLDSVLTDFSSSTLADDEPDCMTAPQPYADKEPRLSIFRADIRYGTAVWMQGTSGTCEGQQWIRFDIDIAIPGPLELRYVSNQWEATGIGHGFPQGLPAGSFDAPVMRDPRIICGLLSVPGEGRETWPVFGNHGTQTPRPHGIPGTMC